LALASELTAAIPMSESALVIRECTPADVPRICDVINEASVAYRGVIAPDRWKEPYMPLVELEHEIAAGVRFWGAYDADVLIAVMGLQDVRDVSLIRHAYTRSRNQGRGIGKALLKHVTAQTTRPILIGTWSAATWAIGFYQSQGFRILGTEKDAVLRRYWSIPERQIEESVVLADERFVPW
jgi:GNAT superfamily N-acetyltransferase